MASKAKTIHTHIFRIDDKTLNVSFEDKRTFNSFVKALEKATVVEFTKDKMPDETLKQQTTEPNEESLVQDPHIFEGWTITENCDHVGLKPPENTQREIVTLNPVFSVKWSPTFTGKYWNDGKYHFYPKKTKLSVEFTKEDIIDNFVSMGAKV